MASHITLGNLTIDRDCYEVRVDGQRVELTYVEFELLFHLAGNAGKVVLRERLVESVWGAGETGGDRKLRVHISRLRKKLARSRPWRINTVTKRGYALVNDCEEHRMAGHPVPVAQSRAELAEGG